MPVSAIGNTSGYKPIDKTSDNNSLNKKEENRPIAPQKLTGENDQIHLSSTNKGKFNDGAIHFVDGHDNDISILSATRMGENAVTWLSPCIISNWKEGESIDQVIRKVSEMNNIGNFSHHPSIFISKNDHENVKNQYCLVFANSDYDKNGKVSDGNDLPDVQQEGKNLEKAYSAHNYSTTLCENINDNEMKKIIRDKVNQSESGDEIVIHYTGHGSENGMEGVNGFVGQFINPFNDTLFNNEIKDLVSKAKDKGIKVVLILDSCQSGYVTDYNRNLEIIGIENTISKLEDVPNLNQNEKDIISNSEQNLNKLKTLMNEIDELHSKPIEADLNGKKIKVDFKESQEFISKKLEKIYGKLDALKYLQFEMEKISLEGEISNLQINKLQIDINKLDDHLCGINKPDSEYENQKKEIDKNIEINKKNIQVLDKSISKYKTNEQNANKFVEDINNKVLGINNQISQKEKEIDSLISGTYKTISNVNGYKPEFSDVKMKKLSFGVSTSYSYNHGPMVQLDGEYKLFEKNRFSDISAKVSFAKGFDNIKTTEAIKYDFTNNNWGTEFGLSQLFGEDQGTGKFKNMLHVGGYFRANSWLNINGGLDISTKYEDKLSRFNPYLGLGININKLINH